MALLISLTLRGCTEIQMRAPSGELVVANSVEEENIPIAHRVSPALRGSKHGHGEGCMSFTAKYGFVGGMNEAGLGINEHALDLAVFQEADSKYPTVRELGRESHAHSSPCVLRLPLTARHAPRSCARATLARGASDSTHRWQRWRQSSRSFAS